MGHLTSANIKSYRGLHNVNLKKLTGINIFVGENNSGKTSILELIQLVSNPLSKREFLNVARLRERALMSRKYTSIEESLIWLFSLSQNKQREEIDIDYQLNNTDITVKCSLDEKEYVVTSNGIDSREDDIFREEVVKELVIYVDVKQNGELVSAQHLFNEALPNRSPSLELKKELFSSRYISAIDHRVFSLSTMMINEIIKEGNRPELLQVLQQFDAKINGIEILIDKVSINSTIAIPYIHHETMGLVPISMFGDGLRKAVLIATRIIRSKNSVLLIDEIETGIHTKLIPTFFEWVSGMCKKYNVQLFATTHSLEALDGILKSNLDSVNRLTIYRLEGDESDTKVRNFTGEKMEKIRYHLGQDVR